MSRAMRVIVLTLAVVTAAVGGEPQTSVNVTEVPPETIPTGTCTQSHTGYLGIVEGDMSEPKADRRRGGEYVRTSLAQGSSVTLWRGYL